MFCLIAPHFSTILQKGANRSGGTADAQVGDNTTLYPKVTSGLVEFDDTQTTNDAFNVSAGLVTVDDAGSVTARKPDFDYKDKYAKDLAVLWS